MNASVCLRLDSERGGCPIPFASNLSILIENITESNRDFENNSKGYLCLLSHLL